MNRKTRSIRRKNRKTTRKMKGGDASKYMNLQKLDALKKEDERKNVRVSVQYPITEQKREYINHDDKSLKTISDLNAVIDNVKVEIIVF